MMGMGMPGGPPVMAQVMGQQPGTPQGPQPNVMPGQMQSLPPEKLDNISKVKSLIGPLRESLVVTLKNAAQTLHHNSIADMGSIKGVDVQLPRFDKSMEEFYSICDQIELHLKTSIECVNQNTSSQRYLNLMVVPTRTEHTPANPQDVNSPLSYPQFLSTVRAQVSYAKEVHDMLLAAAQNITTTE